MEMSYEQLIPSQAPCQLLPKEMLFKICWGDMFANSKTSARSETVSLAEEVQAEIVQYQRETDLSLYGDPLSWWKSKCTIYPQLSNIAKTILAVPATSVPSERVFSAAGELISSRRNRLDPENVNMMLFLHGNM